MTTRAPLEESNTAIDSSTDALGWKYDMENAARIKRIQRELDRKDEDRKYWQKAKEEAWDKLIAHFGTLVIGVFIGWMIWGN